MANGISIKSDDELLRNIHVRAAQKGVSVQRYMNGLIERDLFPERFPHLNAEQLEQVSSTMETISQAVEDVDSILWDRPEQHMEPPGMTLGG